VLVGFGSGAVCAGALQYSPQVVGPSRKSFLGHITNQPDPALRDFATVSACTAAIGSGADIIRVHNWRAGMEAAAVGDAVYRQSRGRPHSPPSFTLGIAQPATEAQGIAL
jgi:hypothetical protein